MYSQDTKYSQGSVYFQDTAYSQGSAGAASTTVTGRVKRHCTHGIGVSGPRRAWWLPLPGSVFAAIIVLLALTACATTKSSISTNEFSVVENNAKILLIEPDVELSLLLASGVTEVNPQWTQQGKKNLLSAMRRSLGEGNDHTLIEHDLNAEFPRELQLVKLHEVVGGAILTQRATAARLPTKKDIFDWTLGPGVQTLAERYEADYALFFFARGQYASAGRQALAIGIAILGGAVSTGGQAAYGSLVDLRTGDVIWFNTAFTGSGTDMRKPQGAAFLAQNILKDIPLNGESR